MDVAWQCISERLWKCLVGRYGGDFEERYNEAYDDRAYHAKGLDAPAKYAPTLEVRKGNARYRRTHSLTKSNQEVHKETSTPRRSVWRFGYPCASSTHC